MQPAAQDVKVPVPGLLPQDACDAFNAQGSLEFVTKESIGRLEPFVSLKRLSLEELDTARVSFLQSDALPLVSDDEYMDDLDVAADLEGIDRNRRVRN